MERSSLLFTATRATGLVLARVFGWLVHLSGGRGAFLDPARFPFTRLMEQHWRSIREEAVAVMARGEARNIQEFFQEQAAITAADRWRSYMFLIYGHRYEEHLARCPVTADLLGREARISSAMFSILAPGASLRPHRGPYKGVLRYHLALVVPGDGTGCVMEVGGERRHWEEGHSLLFDDTLLHAAHNRTDSPRIVLFIDVVRPLPFPLDRLNKLLFKAIARSKYVQDVVREACEVQKLTITRSEVHF